METKQSEPWLYKLAKQLKEYLATLEIEDGNKILSKTIEIDGERFYTAFLIEVSSEDDGRYMSKGYRICSISVVDDNGSYVLGDSDIEYICDNTMIVFPRIYSNIFSSVI